ncbi:MAG: hypothetical protein ACI4QF_02445 [Kiritimatiellia bacterium]
MEPVSRLIDAASDYSEDGKVKEAVAEYKKALAEIQRIRLENPDRVESVEFTTLRNKEAYVNAAIDSLLLSQAQKNARSVAITDTTELEKRFALKKNKGVISDEKKMEIAEKAVEAREEQQVVESVIKRVEAPKVETPQPKGPMTRRERLMQASSDIQAKDFDAAKLTISELLEEKPNDAAALNLRAALETELGDFKAAERTLDQSIQSNPRSHYAYYNMARLFLQTRGAEGKSAAKRYYEAGRSQGGPVDKKLAAACQ